MKHNMHIANLHENKVLKYIFAYSVKGIFSHTSNSVVIFCLDRNTKLCIFHDFKIISYCIRVAFALIDLCFP